MGGRVLFVTGTLRHGPGDGLAATMHSLKGAWAAMWSGRAGQALSVRLGGPMRSLEGAPRAGHHSAFEVTWGEAHGFHPHVHAAVMVGAHVTGDVLEDVTAVLEQRWFDLVEARTGRRPLHGPGFDVREVHDTKGLSDYLAKVEGGWGIGLELARGDCKKRPGRYSVPQLLEAATDGEAWAVEVWCEYERVMHSLHTFSGTRGLRAALGLEEEVSDAEAVIRRLESVADVEVRVGGELYSRLVARGVEHRPRHALEDQVREATQPWPVLCAWVRLNDPALALEGWDAHLEGVGTVTLAPGHDEHRVARERLVLEQAAPVAALATRADRPLERDGRLWTHDGELFDQPRSRSMAATALLRARWHAEAPHPREGEALEHRESVPWVS